MNDPVHHPKHYGKGLFSCECIAISRHMTFNAGNAFKYVWRHQDKGGLQDLEKALVYLGWALEDGVPSVLPGKEALVWDMITTHVLPFVREDEAYLALPLVAQSRLDLAQTHLEIIVEATKELAGL